MENKRSRPVVAIDGPAGTGKSTVTKRVSDELGFVHVDTGALYRSIALLAIREKIISGIGDIISPEEEEKIADIAKGAKISFKRDDSKTPGNRVFVNGNDVTEEIRTSNVTMGSSKVSAIAGVRAALLGLQRNLGADGGAVLEGRDIGTVVFPDAEAKFFLTASLEVRTKRREKELQSKGLEVDFEELKEQIRARDAGDSGRKIAPLMKAEDAIEIDTSEMTIDAVVLKITDVIQEKMEN